MRPVEADKLLAAGDTETAHLITPLLEPSGALTLFGRPGSGKSTIGLQLAVEASGGRAWAGRFATARPLRVLYVETEMTLRRTKETLRRQLTAVGLSGEGVFVEVNKLICIGDGVSEDEFEAESVAPVRPDILVFDALLDILPSGASDERAVSAFYKAVDKLRARYGMAVVLIHHARKAGHTDKGFMRPESMEDALGSIYHLKWPDTMMRLEHEQSGLWRVQIGKVRADLEDDERTFYLTGDKATYLFKAVDSSHPVQQAILDVLASAPQPLGPLREAVMTRLGVSDSTVRRALETLCKAGLTAIEDNPVDRRHKIVSLKEAT